MQLGIRPTVDYAFKKVFGSEENVPVLANLLDAVLKPAAERGPLSLVVMNPFNEKDAPDDFPLWISRLAISRVSSII